MSRICCALLVSISITACRLDRSGAPSSGRTVTVDGQPARNILGTVANYDPDVDYFPQKVSFRHATQLHITYHRTYKVIDYSLNGTHEHARYVLWQRGTPAPPTDPDAKVIQVPVERYALGSYRYAGAVAALHLIDQLVYLANYRQSTTPEIVGRLNDGRLPRNGSPELVAGRDTEVIFGYYSTSMNRDSDVYGPLGVQLVPMAEHLETTPLGKTEWVELFAAFFNREAEAAALFDAAESRYLSLKKVARHVDHRPRVFVYTAARDEWNVFGSGNAYAQLVADAGGEYVWPDVPNGLSITSEPIERAIERGLSADIWMIGPDFTAGTSDPGFLRNQPFPFLRPIRHNAVYVAHRTGTGPNPYWDQALVRPDAELADYLAILHPEILPNHEFVFYRRLDVPPAMRALSQ
jgi:iron complex transport system substrate-binding protein